MSIMNNIKGQSKQSRKKDKINKKDKRNNNLANQKLKEQEIITKYAVKDNEIIKPSNITSIPRHQLKNKYINDKNECGSLQPPPIPLKTNEIDENKLKKK
eukprot:119667_1